MSIQRKERVICSCCGHEQIVPVHDSIYVSLLSGRKEKEAIQKQTLFTIICTSCGSEISLCYPCLYHDAKKKLMIWLLPSNLPNERELLDDILATNIPQGYTSRLVATPLELAEKIAIFDANIDDRIVELCKILMYGDLCDSNPKYEEYDVQTTMYHHNHGTQHTILYHYKCRGRNSSFVVALEDNYYLMVKNAFANTLDRMPCRKFEEINMNWAYDAIDLYRSSK